MKKISLMLVLCIILSFGTNIVASAEEYTVTPRYNNLIYADCTFTIENDEAIATVIISGYAGIISNASVNVKLEKRALLGLIWNDVEEWNSSSSDASAFFEFRKAVGSGTYRCTFEITVEGSGGSADVITEEIKVKN